MRLCVILPKHAHFLVLDVPFGISCMDCGATWNEVVMQVCNSC